MSSASPSSALEKQALKLMSESLWKALSRGFFGGLTLLLFSRVDFHAGKNTMKRINSAEQKHVPEARNGTKCDIAAPLRFPSASTESGSPPSLQQICWKHSWMKRSHPEQGWVWGGRGPGMAAGRAAGREEQSSLR